jgi:hypothetical protein
MTQRTKCFGGWPLPSWFGFAGALFASLAAALEFHATGALPLRVVGAGFICLVIALAARKKAVEE